MKKAYTKEYISHLLCRFMNGETTLDEERMLEEYFRTEKHIPEEWADYKEMFAYFESGMTDTPVAVRHRRLWPWAVAAVAIVITIILLPSFPDINGSLAHNEQQDTIMTLENNLIANIEDTVIQTTKIRHSTVSNASKPVVKPSQISVAEQLLVQMDTLSDEEKKKIEEECERLLAEQRSEVARDLHNYEVAMQYELIENKDNCLQLAVDEEGYYDIINTCETEQIIL